MQHWCVTRVLFKKESSASLLRKPSEGADLPCEKQPKYQTIEQIDPTAWTFLPLSFGTGAVGAVRGARGTGVGMWLCVKLGPDMSTSALYKER